MVTRFVPGGYQPEHAGETTPQRVRRAVEGLGDLMDDYEFHYPGELNAENLDDVREALDGHGIYTVCTGLHLDPPGWCHDHAASSSRTPEVCTQRSIWSR